nr:MAG: hypothetical protein DIU67_05410 [Actinomycetota bacterium]
MLRCRPFSFPGKPRIRTGDTHRIGSVFQPIRTRRLVIRSLVPEDVPILHARRNDPQVAELEAWTLPYPYDKTEARVSRCIELGGPADGEWWMAMVTVPDGTPVGDVAVRLTWGGRSAEVGYTLDPPHWGNGYATEATEALVDWLFDDLGVHRVHATLDPANTASARVLERVGMLYEGRARESFWKGDEVSDDLLYGMTKADRDAWKQRPEHEPEAVELVEITTDNYEAVAGLRVHHSQESQVASVLDSYADAMFAGVEDDGPLLPWMRAVRADGELVGFVMVALPTEQRPEPYLWRLLVDRMHQGRGIGRRVIGILADDARERGAPGMLVSWVESKGSPRRFYEKLGFVPTGRVVDGETEARLALG